MKPLFMKEKENQVIRKDNLLILVLAGILLLVVALPVKTGQDGKTAKKSPALSQAENMAELSGDGGGQSPETARDYTQALENRLEDALVCMEGVGKVKVMITLKSSEEQVVEKDIPNSRSSLTESDSQGSVRNSSEMENTETTVYLTNGDGDKIPYVIKKMEPVVDGIVVVAQGGGSAECCKNITEVAQALFDIPPHKIKVVKMRAAG